MNAATYTTGKVASGDVDIFYRLFGAPGGAPVLIIHGANYYDSGDWVGVAGALSGDRQVVARDTRGFGSSGWSASKDYSLTAHMADINALLDHLGWDKAVIMGHSMGGRMAILFASRFPGRTERLIIVDHCPSSGDPEKGGQKIGNVQKVFPNIEAAQEVMSRDTDTPAGSAARARLEEFLKPVDGGFVFPRDPDFGNPVPVGIAGWTPGIVVADMWAELAAVKAPTMLVRGTLSDRYDDEKLGRVKTDHADIHLVEVESGHDVVGGAEAALIAAVQGYLAAG